ncbi:MULTISPECIES: toll/interleukin-1 receptor domain-containing protein [Streptomyces]|uniref:toll/interleukin-1 receptor domain-containing protein n=1 Tax=Streptomyces TaxID=1883 RepID=UPI000D51F71E|nr:MULTISPECIES: toll/interleukin-1 receptor domain-containing protein [Streptomyces]PVC68959.1 molecular chaperone Tir [Streptomyces sp. CS065A]
MSSYERVVGFWSYTHRDDELNRGRIRKLADLISGEYETITAEVLRIFVDKNDLEWGAEWRARIDAALTGTTFCIPIVTPAFFKSPECRREVLTFSGHAKSLGLEELLLPILYIKVPGLSDDSPDEVMSLIANRQYVDWTTLRTEDEDSPAHRKAVENLAERLVGILERSVQVASENERVIESPTGEESALLETMAEMEAAFPRWTGVVEEFASVMEVIATETGISAAEMQRSDARGGGFAGRLRVSHQLAARITDSVDRFYELGNLYSAELVNVDPGILTLIRETPRQVLTDEDRGTIEEFFSSVRGAVLASRTNIPVFTEFAETVGALKGLSKAMRPLAVKMESAVRQVMDGQAILDEWERLIDENDNF